MALQLVRFRARHIFSNATIFSACTCAKQHVNMRYYKAWRPSTLYESTAICVFMNVVHAYTNSGRLPHVFRVVCSFISNYNTVTVR